MHGACRICTLNLGTVQHAFDEAEVEEPDPQIAASRTASR